ncbi:hypothetical protein HKX48_006119 [Thoreauomyces humboldtii]|nr:hypothetical protein HKX48_006119 [Thoreauomyces humboldtii]
MLRILQRRSLLLAVIILWCFVALANAATPDASHGAGGNQGATAAIVDTPTPRDAATPANAASIAAGNGGEATPVVTPVSPNTPVAPVTPNTPVDPVTPGTPVDPVTPVTPVTPITPIATPVTPIAPITPVAPVTPVVTPVAPVTPVVTPVVPVVPVTPTPVVVVPANTPVVVAPTPTPVLPVPVVPLVTHSAVSVFTSNGVPHTTTTVWVDSVPTSSAANSQSTTDPRVGLQQTSESKGVPTGAVIGGVVGGLCLLAILALLITGYIRWRKQIAADSETGVFGRRDPMSDLFNKQSHVLRSENNTPSVTHDTLSVGGQDKLLRDSPSQQSMRPISPYSAGDRNSLIPGEGSQWNRQPSPYYSPLHPTDNIPVMHETLSAGARTMERGMSPTSEHSAHGSDVCGAGPTVAVRTFEPTNPDEIAISAGDTLNVSQVFTDGWAVGVNARTGQYGAFPMTILQ